MREVLGATWALLLGLLLLMLGNGMQGTLLGIRGTLEGFSTFELSVVMSGYFLGFLAGSRLTPVMIQRVGHVRVFAALASMVSAILILYPAITVPWAWALFRVAFGFCFSGVYVTAESWLNNLVSNENRGKALSAYMLVQMTGVVAAQGLMLTGDASGFILFIVPSVLVSMSFLPILLSISPTPSFENTKRMSFKQLFQSSPLGCVGMFLLGGVFASQFGMASVYGAEAGLSAQVIPLFVASAYVGALLMQYPIGFVSDRMDRRTLAMWVALTGGIASIIAVIFGSYLPVLFAAAMLVGGTSNPLYSLLVAHTNDMLEGDDMAAASGGLLFINGLGAIAGPLITGWLLGRIGPPGFWVFLAFLMCGIAAYALWRMARRPGLSPEETASYAPISPSATPVVVEAAQELYAENLEEIESDREDVITQ